MMPSTRHLPPRLRDVLRAQVHALALTLRWPATIAAALMLLATVMATAQRWNESPPINFHPELSMLPGIVGLFFPLVVWFGIERFGPDFFWTLPVERRRHALARIGAGWICLMAVIAVFMVWRLAITLATGGSVIGPTPIRLLPSHHVPPPGTLHPAMLQTVQWSASPLLWLVPFTAATGAYLLTSALAIGLRHPHWWFAGALLAFLVLDGLRAATDVDWLVAAPQRQLAALFYGPYGVDTLLTARSESLSTEVALSNGQTVGAWRGVPHVGQWAVATLMWIGAGLAALVAAVTRHRDHH